MNKKKYYAVTQTTSFTKTVYVPVECADDIKGAVDLVADSCDVSSPADLCDNWDEFGVEVEASPYADADGICEMTEQDASLCEIVEYVREKGE